MNDPNVIAAAWVMVIGAIVTGAVSIMSNISAAKDRRLSAAERLKQLELAIAAAEETKEVHRKADEIIVGNAEIHKLTNSANSELKEALKATALKVEELQEIIFQMEATERGLAVAAPAIPPVATAPIPALVETT